MIAYLMELSVGLTSYIEPSSVRVKGDDDAVTATDIAPQVTGFVQV